MTAYVWWSNAGRSEDVKVKRLDARAANVVHSGWWRGGVQVMSGARTDGVHERLARSSNFLVIRNRHTRGVNLAHAEHRAHTAPSRYRYRHTTRSTTNTESRKRVESTPTRDRGHAGRGGYRLESALYT
jgi:hypothetical protein